MGAPIWSDWEVQGREWGGTLYRAAAVLSRDQEETVQAPGRQEAPICVCKSVKIPPPRLSVCEKCGEILLRSDWRDQRQRCQWKEHDVYDCYTGRKSCISVSDLTSLNGNLHFLICAMGTIALTTGHCDAQAS